MGQVTRRSPRDTGRRLLRERRIKRHLPRHPMRLLALIAGAGLLVVIPGLLASNLVPGLRDFVLRESTLAGLRVADIVVTGRHETTAADIRAALGVERNDPILAVPLDAARKRLEALPWVRSAIVERQLPDTIRVRLVERKPMALLGAGDHLVLLDTDGQPIRLDDLTRFGGLLEVVGKNAAAHARALVDLVASEEVLAPRVESAVWVEDARWNVRLAPGIEVKLPSEPDQLAAWHRLAAMERTDKLIESCATMIDLRLPGQMPVSCGTNVVPVNKDQQAPAAAPAAPKIAAVKAVIPPHGAKPAAGGQGKNAGTKTMRSPA